MASSSSSSSSSSHNDWWRETTIYQIYPRSFCDSDGDGIGDIPGIISKLDYLKDLGVETLWLSPIYSSPQEDHGYDISDYTSIAPEYGTMQDVREMIKAVHDRNMKIVFDMVMNHTSDQHQWFQDSAHRRNDKEDWYIWHDGVVTDDGKKQAPNNWRGMLGNKAWIYHEVRQQYYLASFLSFQPDLNYRHSAVKKEMLGVVKFWIDQGVDGFRLDIFNVIYKDAQLRDNPFCWKLAPSHEDTDGYFQKKIHTINHPDTIAFAKELRHFVDTQSSIRKSRFLVGEIMGQHRHLKAFLGEPPIHPGLNLCFMFQMVNFQFHANYFKNIIQEFEHFYPAPHYTPVLVYSNHDIRRMVFRLNGNVAKIKVMATLQMTLRGVPCMYYGEEIGMTESTIPFSKGQDPIIQIFGKMVPQVLYDSGLLNGVSMNRDNCRTPMQWTSDERHGGFMQQQKQQQQGSISSNNEKKRNAKLPAAGEGETILFEPLLDVTQNTDDIDDDDDGAALVVEPWLPVNKDTAHGVNVEAQMEDEHSMLSIYRTLLQLRRAEPALFRGSFTLLDPKLISSSTTSISSCCRISKCCCPRKSLLGYERWDSVTNQRMFVVFNFAQSSSGSPISVDMSSIYDRPLSILFSTDARNKIILYDDEEEKEDSIQMHGPSAMILRDICNLEKKES